MTRILTAAAPLARARPSAAAVFRLPTSACSAHLQRRAFSQQTADAGSEQVPKTLWALLCGYALLVNAGAAALVYYDKHQANTHGWRVRERDLHLSAALGGWIGGLYAMQGVRHKTVKKSFQQPYMIATALNIAACIGAVAAWRSSPGLRSATIRSIKSMGLP